MGPKDAIRYTLTLSDTIINGYINDLNDADLMIRPVAGMNTIAWQLGHLIGSERHFVELIQPGSSPPLPADFEAGHNRNAHTSDDATKVYPRARYQELWKAQRAATLRLLDSLSDSDLDRA